MTKILGAVLLIVTSVGYGFTKIREERRKIELNDAFCELVKHIRENIAHYMKPLGEIFSSYEGGILEDCGFLGDCRTVGIRLAWERSHFHLSEKPRRLMEDFANSIGGGYREDELNLCDYTASEMEKISRAMREEAVGREKMYRTIPPLLALSVVLIFM